MKKLVLVVSVALIAATTLAGTAEANHSWGRYHWARTSNPFNVRLGKNVSSAWGSLLTTAASDWSQSTVLDAPTVTGGTDGQHCDPTSGRVEVCSFSYGSTGWLGLAQIWITVGNHIVQGVVELNDSYFGNSNYQYNNTAEMQHVVCQEVGHTFGLDHQSETGVSLNTCMDYYHNTSNGDTLSTHPNQGDYDELLCIYDPAYKHKTLANGGHKCRGTGHLDSYSTVGSASGSLAGSVPSFSPASQVSESRFVRQLPNGDLLVTWITWAHLTQSNS